MKILINGQEAVLKKGMSFQYVSENPLFTEAEDYTMEITFPMKDSPQNVLIFGPLHVKGVEVGTVKYSCEIITETFSKTGILVITEIGSSEVKGQFLEGMSASRFSNSGMESYIDELDYSSYDGTTGDASYVEEVMQDGWSPLVVWDSRLGEFLGQSKGIKDNYVLHIHLWRLMDIVAELCALNIDKSKLLAIPFFEKVVIANSTLDWRNCDDFFQGREPAGYPYYAARKEFMHLEKTLPHWTVREFFEEVGRFFGCFVISENNSISFIPFSSYLNSNDLRNINVLDEFIVNVGSTKESGFASLIKYKLPDECNPDNINICPQIEEHIDEVLRSDTASRDGYTPEHVANHPINMDNFLYYYPSKSLVKIGNEYVAITDVQTKDDFGYKFIKFEKLNQYGRLTDGEDLRIVPCPLEYKTKDKQFFPRNGATLDCTLVGAVAGRWEADADAIRRYYHKVPVVEAQYKETFTLLGGEYIDVDILRKEGYEALESHYDKLYVVLYNGNDIHGEGINTRKYEPVMGTVYASDYLESLEEEEDVIPYYKGLREYDYTLAPSDGSVLPYVSLPKLDEKKLYRYKFLEKSIPPVTSVFVIKGKKYACLRITAHFTVDGMSELLEGEFYEITG